MFVFTKKDDSKYIWIIVWSSQDSNATTTTTTNAFVEIGAFARAHLLRTSLIAVLFDCRILTIAKQPNEQYTQAH